MAVILATHLDHPGGQGGCRQRHCWTHDQGVDEAKVELQEMQIYFSLWPKITISAEKSFCHGKSEENPFSWVTRAKNCIQNFEKSAMISYREKEVSIAHFLQP